MDSTPDGSLISSWLVKVYFTGNVAQKLADRQWVIAGVRPIGCNPLSRILRSF